MESLLNELGAHQEDASIINRQVIEDRLLDLDPPVEITSESVPIQLELKNRNESDDDEIVKNGEVDGKELRMDLIEQLLSEKNLSSYDGFGISFYQPHNRNKQKLEDVDESTHTRKISDNTQIVIPNGYESYPVLDEVNKNESSSMNSNDIDNKMTEENKIIDQKLPIKKIKTQIDNICPLCNREVNFDKRENFELTMSKHVDRCSRRENNHKNYNDLSRDVMNHIAIAFEKSFEKRKLTRSNISVIEISDDSSSNEIEKIPTKKLKKKKNELNRSTRSTKPPRNIADCKDQINYIEINSDKCFDSETDDEGHSSPVEAMVQTSSRPVSEDGVYDDWEEVDYLNRLQQMISENLLQPREEESSRFDVKKKKVRADGAIKTAFDTWVLSKTWNSLHEFQKEGCNWLYDLYQEGVGGILGDEMGLGKTAQLCTHFGSLSYAHDDLHHREYRSIDEESNEIPPSMESLSAAFLIVCPATVLKHWLVETQRWSSHLRCGILHSISATGREICKMGDEAIELVIKKLRNQNCTRGLAIITSYEGIRRHKVPLSSIEWTAVCLDEGQKIRNPNSEITIVCKELPAFHRIILSGTPIQNNLRELWSLFDFIYPGRLGNLSAFDTEFIAPIRRGGYLDATHMEYEIAVRSAAALQRMVRPYLLRRKKQDLQEVTKLPPKTEQVLFCQISPAQRELYLKILASSEVKAVIEKRASGFRAITTLRKLCNHPALVYRQGKIHWQTEIEEMKRKEKENGGKYFKCFRNGDDDEIEDDEEETAVKSLLRSVRNSKDEQPFSLEDRQHQKSLDSVWADSGKLLVLSKVLPLWHREGHKVLVFSQTRTMLDLIEFMVQEHNLSYLRMDGNTPVGKRAQLVDRFNRDSSIFVMLLTTKTGGVGISLTGANRVILFDPDWNPMTDTQSRERAWRLGQLREVIVYRLITRGTIEEKIYQRQIFKLLLSNRILDNPKQRAMFSRSDIKELFQLNEQPKVTTTQNKIRSDQKVPTTTSSHSMDSQKNAHHSTELDWSCRYDSRLNQSKSYQDNFNHQDDSTVVSGDPIFRLHINSNSKDLQYSSDLPRGGLIPFSQNSLETTVDRKTTSSNRHTESSSNGINVQDASYSIEDYKQENLPKAIMNQIEISVDSINTLGGSDKSTNTDKRLLRALFEGDAISSVYDHDYIDPNSKGFFNGLEKDASRAVNNSLQILQTSKIHYNMSSSSPTVQVNDAVKNIDERIPLTSSKKIRKQTVRESIQERLEKIFRSSYSCPPVQLKTEDILKHFKDLGDQYAPLFREILRSVAILKDSYWIKR